ncbi:MAG: signal peptidase I [Herbinix sp.]|nr:signal peptidase I [Herbinix sp.]
MVIKKEMIKEVISWVIVVCAAFVLAFLINSKAYANVQVQQHSMDNTLNDSQRLIVDELSYKFNNPERGDIITFYKNEDKGTIVNDLTRNIDNFISNMKTGGDNEEHERLIKRVIGIEGDVIDIKDGAVYLNGEKLDETYAKGITDTNGLQTPVTVGKNQLFVLGDNRLVSIDSREIGMVNLRQVEGKAIFRIYPFNKMGKLD